MGMKRIGLLHLLNVFLLSQCLPAPKLAGQFTNQEFDDRLHEWLKVKGDKAVY